MSQPTPTPSPDNPPTAPDNNPPQDPQRAEALGELRTLVKEAVLEVITEREAAPPKGKHKVDVLQMLFGPGK